MKYTFESTDDYEAEVMVKAMDTHFAMLDLVDAIRGHFKYGNTISIEDIEKELKEMLE